MDITAVGNIRERLARSATWLVFNDTISTKQKKACWTQRELARLGHRVRCGWICFALLLYQMLTLSGRYGSSASIISIIMIYTHRRHILLRVLLSSRAEPGKSVSLPGREEITGRSLTGSKGRKAEARLGPNNGKEKAKIICLKLVLSTGSAAQANWSKYILLGLARDGEPTVDREMVGSAGWLICCDVEHLPGSIDDEDSYSYN